MELQEIRDYYSRQDVQEFLLDISREREVVGVFRDGGFSSRPGVLIYPGDIQALLKSGVVAFHGSIERWSKPMALKQDNYESLRKGFDLILDLDCKVFEHGKIAAKVFLLGLEKHGISSHYLKFTGGKGFHIGIPWEAMPEKIDYKPSEKLFPGLARNMGLYLREFLREKLERELLKRQSPEELAEQVGKPLGEIMGKDVLDPYKVVDIDPVLISPRHLFRLPYSLHEKSFLVSLPLKLGQLDEFRKQDAEPGKVRVINKFLDRAGENEAEALIAETLDWASRIKTQERKRFRERPRFGKAIPPRFFPPCIEKIREGLQDGKKRSVFVLTNFLSTMGWKWEDIERILQEWNEKNEPPLSESYLKNHVRWHRNRKESMQEPGTEQKSILPPNCAKEGYYQDIGVCNPDGICGREKKTIKNPVNYPFRKMKALKGKFKSRPKK